MGKRQPLTSTLTLAVLPALRTFQVQRKTAEPIIGRTKNAQDIFGRLLPAHLKRLTQQPCNQGTASAAPKSLQGECGLSRRGRSPAFLTSACVHRRLHSHPERTRRDGERCGTNPVAYALPVNRRKRRPPKVLDERIGDNAPTEAASTAVSCLCSIRC